MSEPIQPIQLSGIPPTDLDRPMTAAEFAAWLDSGVGQGVADLAPVLCDVAGEGCEAGFY